MKALYIVVSMNGKLMTTCNSLTLLQSYDYTLEKVKLFTKVPLGDIVGVSKGFVCLLRRMKAR